MNGLIMDGLILVFIGTTVWAVLAARRIADAELKELREWKAKRQAEDRRSRKVLNDMRQKEYDDD